MNAKLISQSIVMGSKLLYHNLRCVMYALKSVCMKKWMSRWVNSENLMSCGYENPICSYPRLFLLTVQIFCPEFCSWSMTLGMQLKWDGCHENLGIQVSSPLLNHTLYYPSDYLKWSNYTNQWCQAKDKYQQWKIS